MTDLLTWLSELSIATFVRESNSLFAFPGFLFVHTVGVAIVAGGSAMIAFALLGMWPPTTSLKPLERLYPAIWFGFWINLLTGLGLLLADATTKGLNPVLWVKLVFVIVGVLMMSRIRKVYFKAPVDLPVPGQAKVMASVALFCWFGAIIAGRLIAYVGGYNGPGF